jgi:biotin operon repressor
MDVDGSFAEYVAARWSMLHRLATLLVGPDGADELARTALARAHVSWRALHDPALVDHSVKAILAREATRTSAPGSPPFDTQGSTGDEAREQLGALAARQRALLVLRYHEGFSDVEIADALGCSRKAVAADALALDRGLDVGELREELRRRSDEAVVPHPPLDAILGAGHAESRRRRRRSWRWTAAAAGGLVVALLVANAVGGATGRPDPEERPQAADPPPTQSLASLPNGEPPQIAYALGRSLHLASGTVVHLGGVPTGILQTRTWLYAAYLSGAVVRIGAARGDQHVAAASSQGELATDPSGEHLAWLAPGGGSAKVVLRTVWDGAVALSDEQEFPARPHCCDNPFTVNGITTDGQVIASLPAMQRAWVWTTPDGGTADQVRRIEGLADGTVRQVAAAGVVVEHPSLLYELGAIDEGRFVRTAVLRARQADFADPLGHRVLYVDDDGALHVREIANRGKSDRGSEDLWMGLPTLEQGFTGVRWEDSEHVLLDVADPSLPHGALVRCAVETGSCEIAVRFDRAHLVAD